jgi:hypothetical protein
MSVGKLDEKNIETGTQSDLLLPSLTLDRIRDSSMPGTLLPITACGMVLILPFEDAPLLLVM